MSMTQAPGAWSLQLVGHPWVRPMFALGRPLSASDTRSKRSDVRADTAHAASTEAALQM